MVEVERVEEWLGQEVIDSRGESLGSLQQVFYDSASGGPILIAVRDGFFGRKTRLIPIEGAIVSRAHIRVSYEKEQIKRSEEDFGSEPIGPDELEKIAVVYGLDFSGSGEIRTAKEWSKGRDDAQRRAIGLAREAENKLARSKAAREQADAAMSDADVAEQEAERARHAADEALEATKQYPIAASSDPRPEATKQYPIAASSDPRPLAEPDRYPLLDHLAQGTNSTSTRLPPSPGD